MPPGSGEESSGHGLCCGTVAGCSLSPTRALAGTLPSRCRDDEAIRGGSALLGMPARGLSEHQASGRGAAPCVARKGLVLSRIGSLWAMLAPGHPWPVAHWGLCVVCACLWVTFPRHQGSSAFGLERPGGEQTPLGPQMGSTGVGVLGGRGARSPPPPYLIHVPPCWQLWLRKVSGRPGLGVCGAGMRVWGQL